jgi:hypothetical protein
VTTQRLESQSAAAADLTPHVLADGDLAWINRGFDARSRINAVTIQIAVCIYGNIANVNTNAEIVCATSCG